MALKNNAPARTTNTCKPSFFSIRTSRGLALAGSLPEIVHVRAKFLESQSAELCGPSFLSNLLALFIKALPGFNSHLGNRQIWLSGLCCTTAQKYLLLMRNVVKNFLGVMKTNSE